MDYDCIPTNFNAVEYFHKLLGVFVVKIFIDSLDQLANDDQARIKVSFLDGVKPHPLTRIIVSMLPDESDQVNDSTVQTLSGSHHEQTYWYGCDTQMKLDDVPRVVVEKLSSAQDEIQTTLCELLRVRNMKLCDEQLHFAVRQIERYPTALYLRLVVRVVTEWRSFDTDYEKTLPVGVPMLIDAIYQEIEVIYGPVLCRRALSLITFSKGGVSDGEMEDLLSMDDAVLGEVFQYSDPGVQRLPSHVWSRIRSSLMDLIKMEN